MNQVRLESLPLVNSQSRKRNAEFKTVKKATGNHTISILNFQIMKKGVCGEPSLSKTIM